MTAREEFLQVLRAHHGIYLDALWGFRMVRTQIEQAQSLSLKHENPSATTAKELDEVVLFVGDKDPAEHRVEHVAKMGWFKKRNSPGELNYVFLGNLLLVSIFSFWEENYRSLIALELSIAKEQLLIPVLGDIRLLRNDIIHHSAVATERIERCEVLRWFKPGDRISLEEQQVDTIVCEIRNSIGALGTPPAT
jgi:hypothetical protein